MRPTTVVELARRHGVELPEGLREGRYEFRDFRHFIDEWVAGLLCLHEPDEFARVALEFCEDEAALVEERKRRGGLPTKIGDHFTVHGRSGTPCPVCGDDLRRVSYESHEVTYCPSCQTGGKVLADRRLSRLIR